MIGAGVRYARRAVETALVARAEYLLADADPTPKVLVMLGAPGNGGRATLLHGVAPRLTVRCARAHGDWAADAVVQLCLDPAEVPDAPPQPGSGIRLVLIAAHRLDALPAWVVTGRPADVVTLGPLSLGELDGFLAARMGGPVEAGDAETLAHAAGFVPAVLAWLLDTLHALGRLVQLDGVWRLSGPVETEALQGLVAARLAAMSPAQRAVAQEVALGEPLRIPADRTALDALEAQGLIDVVAGGRVAFRAPLIAAAVRATAPAELADRIHARAIERGAVTPQAMMWALEHGRQVPFEAVREAIERTLERRDGAASLRLVEAALALDDGASPADAAREAWLHLRGADAARRLPDAERALGHLAEAAELIAPLPHDSALHLDAAATTAEVLGFVEGDADAALAVLRACPAPDPRVAADLAALEYLHLVTAARLDEAEQLLGRHRGDFRGARPALRTRTRLAGHIALVARGRPQAALRKTIPVLARQTLSLRPHPEVMGEAQIAYVVAALGSDGPAAFPALARQFEAPQEHGYRPDPVGFACTRATWELAGGDVAAARRIALSALGTSEYADASGVGALLTALLAACSALLGDRESAVVLAERLSSLPPRASRMTQGARDAHEVVTAFCLGSGGVRLARERGMAHLAAGHLGFAAEVLHAAVRFGDVESARALTPLGEALDGRLHGIRVAHARALVAGDAVALVSVAEEFRRAGLPVHAAEAAQQALGCAGVPGSLERSARSYPAAVLAETALPGHPLLAGAGPDAVPGWGGETLTPREAEMLRLIEAGLSNADIAAQLHLSPRTVEGHITRLYRKTGGSRRAPARRLERP